MPDKGNQVLLSGRKPRGSGSHQSRDRKGAVVPESVRHVR